MIRAISVLVAIGALLLSSCTTSRTPNISAKEDLANEATSLAQQMVPVVANALGGDVDYAFLAPMRCFHDSDGAMTVAVVAHLIGADEPDLTHRTVIQELEAPLAYHRFVVSDEYNASAFGRDDEYLRVSEIVDGGYAVIVYSDCRNSNRHRYRTFLEHFGTPPVDISVGSEVP